MKKVPFKHQKSENSNMKMRIQTSTYGFLFPAFVRTDFAGMTKNQAITYFYENYTSQSVCQ